ncbi:MAG: hypothetical protein Q7R60_03810 [bacterium]|nr:hypothetical protein [bacterium]
MIANIWAILINMQKILVTGGASFIGNSQLVILAEGLIKSGYGQNQQSFVENT